MDIGTKIIEENIDLSIDLFLPDGASSVCEVLFFCLKRGQMVNW